MLTRLLERNRLWQILLIVNVRIGELELMLSYEKKGRNRFLVVILNEFAADLTLTI